MGIVPILAAYGFAIAFLIAAGAVVALCVAIYLVRKLLNNSEK